MRLSVLLVDRHSVVREGLRAWLAGPDFDVVGDVATSDEALEAASRLRPDLVVLDARLADGGGAALCAAIAELLPETAVVVYAGELDEETVLAAAAAGARAYLLKNAQKPDLANVLKRVAAGERFVDPTVAAMLFRAQGPRARPRLTAQEVRVLQLAAQGFTNREIGARLYLSRHTVKEYLSHAMRKLDATNRVEVVRKATEARLIEGPAASQNAGSEPPTLVYRESGTSVRPSDLRVAPLKLDQLTDPDN
jgi:two-component system, NarL family, response regulator DevR